MARTAKANVPAWVIASASVLVFIGCKKPDQDLGLDLLPNDPLGVMVDSATLRAYTFVDSAVQTSGLTRNLVGAYLDPEFGSVETGLVTQVRLTTNNLGQGQDNSQLSVDSIVLSLVYEIPNTHYGNLNTQRFHVYEVTEALSVDSVYRTDDVPEVNGEDLVYPHRGEITPAPYSPVYTPTDTLVSQLRIRLKDDLARRFLDAFGTADLVDNTSFLQFFKGVYVTAELAGLGPGQGGVLHMNTLSNLSKISMHYKDGLSAEPDLPRVYDFVVNSNCVRYSVARHDHSVAISPDLPNALMDTVGPAPEVYVQTLGGLRTAIRFPDVLDLFGIGRILAKAELVVPISGTFNPYYAPPAQVFIFRKGENGEDFVLPDQLNGTAGIGGQYLTTEKEYRFNITRYMQGLANGTIPNNGVVLVAGSSGVSANRATMCGPDHSATPMQLELTFTTY